MQDKPHHTYTNDFIDSKWNDMSKKLDIALPVEEEQSNNRAIWILSLLLLLAVAVAGYYAYQFKHLIPNAELIKEQVIYKNIYINEGVSPAAKKQPETLGNPKKAQTPISQAVTQRVELYSGLKGIYTETPSATVSQPSTSPESQTNPGILNNLENISSKKSKLEKDDNKVLLSNSQKTDLKTERKVKIGAALTAISTRKRDFTGYGIGSSMDIPVGKKLEINTGLAFNVLSRDHFLVKEVEEVNNRLPAPPRSPKQAIVYEDELRSLKQLSMPLGLNYSLSNALSLNSGVKLRYTYSTDLDKDPVPSQGYPADSESFFTKTNIGFSAGLKYSLNNHFSILLDSEWGMGSFARSTQYSNLSTPNHDLNLVNLTTNFTF